MHYGVMKNNAVAGDTRGPQSAVSRSLSFHTSSVIVLGLADFRQGDDVISLEFNDPS